MIAGITTVAVTEIVITTTTADRVSTTIMIVRRSRLRPRRRLGGNLMLPWCNRLFPESAPGLRDQAPSGRRGAASPAMIGGAARATT